MQILAVSLWLASSLCGAGSAQACFSPPGELTVHHAELVRRTSRIALARFEGDRGGDREFHFTSIEVLKGNVPQTFTLTFDSYRPHVQFQDSAGADFHGHEDWGFWEELVTRQGNDIDCQMRPEFEAGATYLLFLDPPYHWRSFERVERKDDRWLSAVRALVAAPDAASGMMLSLRDYLREQKAIFVGRVRACAIYDEERASYPAEVRVQSVLSGKIAGTVRISGRGVESRCRPGVLVLGVVHRLGVLSGKGESKPPGRLLPLENPDGSAAQRLSKQLRVNFDGGDSEAVITQDPFPTLARLRALVAEATHGAAAPASDRKTPQPPAR